MVFVRDFKKEFYDIVQHQVCVTNLYKLIGCGWVADIQFQSLRVEKSYANPMTKPKPNSTASSNPIQSNPLCSNGRR